MRYLTSVSKPDLIGACITIAIGAFVAAWSPTYGLRTGQVIGPGFVPFAFGVAMAVFGIAAVVGAVIRARREAMADRPAAAERASSGAVVEAPDGGAASEIREASAADADGVRIGGDAEESTAPTWRKAGIVFIVALAAVALTPVLGIAVAFGLAAVAMLCFIDRERWWLSIIVSAGVMILLYLLFADFLKIPIPIGPWGF
ncbi:tripartite tricarboxylate transporter TctB family protein [Spelaeicoccus albus]|uniref:Membrane protein implicated in regulation of membrane protease activity n=1 Tax=Spelaeicoccus albus TaxID=1280376 RepID=A0A7Z0A9Z0_9MICO|nr:tripartite tricarboxylate transporter TctB family protein [Spelaeicoccus albus]NYI67147.1 membrane protein implicated in regulation of membrane protease activity [Spelaeicoccus albus]